MVSHSKAREINRERDRERERDKEKGRERRRGGGAFEGVGITHVMSLFRAKYINGLRLSKPITDHCVFLNFK